MTYYLVYRLGHSSYNWNDAGNWSLSSGGPTGAGVPGTAQGDSVIIDGNSVDHNLPENNILFMENYTANYLENLTIVPGFGFTLNLGTGGLGPGIYGSLNIVGTVSNPINLISPTLFNNFVLLGTLVNMQHVVATNLDSTGGYRIYYDPTINTVTNCPYWVQPTPPAWMAGVNYHIGDYVSYAETLHQCIVAHTSTVFTNDFWSIIDPSQILFPITVHIQNPTQLLQMYNAPDNNYILDNDIDMTGITWIPPGSYLTTFDGLSNGVCLNPFTGSFNGQGFTILNLTYDDTTPNLGCGGLFGVVGNISAPQNQISTIQNLNMNNVILTGTGNLGAVVGLASQVNFNNINLTNITITVLVDGGGAGALAGLLSTFPSPNPMMTVENIIVSGVNINCDSGVGAVGGLIGGI